MVTTAGVALLEGGQGDAQVFIAKRRPGKYLGECWEFPGGKVNGDENPADALKREYKEEFGVDIEVKDRLCTGEFWGNGNFYRIEAFWISIYGDPVCAEHTEAKWVPLREVFRYTVPPSDSIVLGALRRYESLMVQGTAGKTGPAIP